MFDGSFVLLLFVPRRHPEAKLKDPRILATTDAKRGTNIGCLWLAFVAPPMRGSFAYGSG